jgi:hypothetical protein
MNWTIYADAGNGCNGVILRKENAGEKEKETFDGLLETMRKYTGDVRIKVEISWNEADNEKPYIDDWIFKHIKMELERNEDETKIIDKKSINQLCSSTGKGVFTMVSIGTYIYQENIHLDSVRFCISGMVTKLRTVLCNRFPELKETPYNIPFDKICLNCVECLRAIEGNGGLLKVIVDGRKVIVQLRKPVEFDNEPFIQLLEFQV